MLQFLTKSRAQLSNKFPDPVTVQVRWHVKIGWANCRISGESVVNQLQMSSGTYNTENTSADSLGSSSKSWEVVPRPCPLLYASLGALVTGERSLVGNIAAAVLMAAGWGRGLKAGQVGLRSRPSGHKFFMSSKTFLWLYFVP